MNFDDFSKKGSCRPQKKHDDTEAGNGAIAFHLKRFQAIRPVECPDYHHSPHLELGIHMSSPYDLTGHDLANFPN
ncbi:MAG: hypothetical protein VKL39_12920 [Leptolyngbyaceae bacterium]|nr:hypothetical protein [Leptolyngbyaceae bacterium]